MRKTLILFSLVSIELLLFFFLKEEVLANSLTQGLNSIRDADTDLRTTGNIISYVGSIISWLLGLIGTVFFGLVLFNGYNYMTAGSDSNKISNSVSGIVSAVIGLFIVFGSYLIAEYALSIVVP
jgi:hypothetical protein